LRLACDRFEIACDRFEIACDRFEIECDRFEIACDRFAIALNLSCNRFEFALQFSAIALRNRSPQSLCDLCSHFSITLLLTLRSLYPRFEAVVSFTIEASVSEKVQLS
jgi:hypothetical protein